MRLSVQLESLKKSAPDIWVTLEKIQHTLGWADSELQERLCLTQKKYEHMRAGGLPPSVYSTGELVSSIGLSLELITKGTIDYRALKAQANGQDTYMPNRFSVGAFSKKRTSINLLSYLETRFGWRLKKYILDHFQVTEALFQNPDESINFLFPSELCRFLADSGYHFSIFKEMGAYSLSTNRNSKLGLVMASFQTPKIMLERVFGEIAPVFFDKNCTYKILKLNKNECVIEARYSSEMKASLGLLLPGNRHACAVRAGSLTSFTGYLGLPFSKVVETKCIHLGDVSCRYKIFFEAANRALKSSVNSGFKLFS